MKTYTILLQRPDYASDNYGLDTYMTTVEADNVSTAQKKAQAEAAEADNGPDHDPEDLRDPDDYAVLMVIAGEHMDIKET